MPILKKEDVLPERPVIIVLYGVPGSGKTSVATTAENPLLIDCDRGSDRAVQRCDTIIASKWQDIDSERESMKGYKTIVIDTAKACLDDYLSQYAIENNYKLKTNGLKRFGQMADDFKDFVNFLRSNNSDIVFICHDKETQDGDVIKHSPDCTGQSKDLLIRIADQVGYIFIQNNQRCITFSPQDNYVGKNVAGLGLIQIPQYGTKEFETCMSDIIKSVKDSMRNRNEEQNEAYKLVSGLRAQLEAAATDNDIAMLIDGMKSLPKALLGPFFKDMKDVLAKKGFTYVAKDKKFVKDEWSE